MNNIRRVIPVACFLVFASLSDVHAGVECRIDLGGGFFSFVTDAFGSFDDFSEDNYWGDAIYSYDFTFPQLTIALFDMGLYAQFPLASATRLGLGLRSLNLFLAGVHWPNVYLEQDVGNFTFRAQVGGGIMFVNFYFLVTSLSGPIVIPDLAVTYRFGQHLRLSGGVSVPMYFETQGIDPLCVPYITFSYVEIFGSKSAKND